MIQKLSKTYGSRDFAAAMKGASLTASPRGETGSSVVLTTQRRQELTERVIRRSTSETGLDRGALDRVVRARHQGQQLAE